MVNTSPPVNLLPAEVKQGLVVRYYIALASLFFTLLAIVTAAGAALLTPSFLLAESGEKAALNILDSTEKTLGIKEKSGANAAVVALSERVHILDAYEFTPIMMHTLGALGGTVVKGISVKSIKIRETESGIGTIQVAGTATSRATLLSFANALKADRFFTGVSVPVEQLAGESDIEFQLAFSYALP